MVFDCDHLTGRIYEWKHGKATLASSEAPYFLPGLFTESVWPGEKITFVFTSQSWHDRRTHFLSLGGHPLHLKVQIQEWQGRKEPPLSHLTQPESIPETNPQVDRHGSQTPSFPRHDSLMLLLEMSSRSWLTSKNKMHYITGFKILLLK